MAIKDRLPLLKEAVFLDNIFPKYEIDGHRLRHQEPIMPRNLPISRLIGVHNTKHSDFLSGKCTVRYSALSVFHCQTSSSSLGLLIQLTSAPVSGIYALPRWVQGQCCKKKNSVALPTVLKL